MMIFTTSMNTPAQIVVIVAAGVLGLCFGSFANVVVYRVPRGLSVVRPRSACPGCHTPIKERDNIPVLSWILLKGRCRSCGMRISVRYPLIELGVGIAFAAIAAVIVHNL
jgi:leader peptidase (prepilin peptidase)/N-methyltransferase